MKKLLFLISTLVIMHNTFAIVPTIDQHQLTQDLSTMASYTANIGGYLSKLSKVMTVADQIRQLHGLEQIGAAGNALCELCNPSDQQQLTNYINQVNSDLCSQFSFAIQNITGLTKSFNNIVDIINLFQTNPKAAAMALQQAAIQTQMATQNTLTQIQMLMAQKEQKQLAEQKLEKQNTDLIYQGFAHSGL